MLSATCFAVTFTTSAKLIVYNVVFLFVCDKHIGIAERQIVIVHNAAEIAVICGRKNTSSDRIYISQVH